MELLERPELRGLPVAVCGSAELRHGIVLAKNDVAKRAGVKTGMAVWQAREICANLVPLAPHMSKYLDYSRRARDIYRSYTDRIEPFGIDECWMDMTGSTALFGSGERIAEELRERVKKELGVTVSVGVSFNKIFAKLGSDYKKPDAVSAFTRGNYRERVWPLPVEELLYVGRSTSRRLRAMGICTIGELASTDYSVLALRLGKMGEALWGYANGMDLSPVLRESESYAIKSVGNSTTTPRDIKDDADAKKVIYCLADSVGSRLRADGFLTGGVEIWVRDTELRSFIRQRALERPTMLSSVIARESLSLFRRSYDWRLPLRSLGVRAIRLMPITTPRQLCFYEDDVKLRRLEALELSIDSLRRRYGYRSVMRGLDMADDSLPFITPDESREAGPSMYEMRPQR